MISIQDTNTNHRRYRKWTDVTAQRSKSMDALYRNIKAVWPGVVIGWVGDPAHAARVSDHNPDDTAGVRAGQTDADTLQEVRALDVMYGPAFTRTDANALVRVLLAKESRARLFYVIHDESTWGRPYWTREDYDGDPHKTHVHVSGWAGDDANGADWPHVLALGDQMGMRDDADFAAVMYRVQGLLNMADPVTLKLPTGDRQEANQFAAKVTELQATTTALVTAIAGLADRIEELAGNIGQAGNGTAGPTAAQIAEEFGTRLSTP